MDRILVWDLPVRLFHWLLAGGFAAAAMITLILGEHSPWFPYHAVIGLTLGLMILLRALWGIVGTRHARFAAFAFAPSAVLRYVKQARAGAGERHAGHNPASAYAIFAMLALTAALVVTGLMLGRGVKQVKETHELLAYAMVGVVIVHVLGVLLHTIRYKEAVTLSMIHGYKNADAAEAIPSPRFAAAVFFLLIVSVWAISLTRGLDAATGRMDVPLLGVRLQIGEIEGEGRPAGPGERRHRDDDD